MEAVVVFFAKMKQASMGVNQGVSPEPPDLLLYYFQLERTDWHVPMWAGGLHDQPAQFMWEISCVEEGIRIAPKPDPKPADPLPLPIPTNPKSGFLH